MRRPASLTAAALIAAIAIAACGGSNKPPTKSASSKLASDSGIALAKCMRTHGVPNFPDPSESGSGGGLQVQSSSNGSGQNVTVNGVSVNAPAFQHAMNVCQSKMPAPPPMSAARVNKIRQSALKLADCMRSHGVPNFPDPRITTGPDGRGIGVQIGAGSGSVVDPQSPAFQRAQATCGPLMGGHLAALPGSKPQSTLGASKQSGSGTGKSTASITGT